MKTEAEFYNLEDHELIYEILCLQKQLGDLRISESKSSAIHNYHFTSEKLLKLDSNHFLGSAVVLTLHDIKGVPLINPTSISDGLSNESINSLLDDLSRTYKERISFKPTEKRLSIK